MKKMFRILLVLMVITLPSLSFAQQKIGYTDADLILSALPDAVEVDSAIVKYQGMLQTQIESMENELVVLEKEYREKGRDWPPAILEQKNKEFQQKRQNLEEFAVKAEQDLERKKQELLAPVFEKITKSIEKVAKANGFAMIVSSNAVGFPILLSGDDSLDITNLVIKDLGGKPIEKKQ